MRTIKLMVPSIAVLALAACGGGVSNGSGGGGEQQQQQAPAVQTNTQESPQGNAQSSVGGGRTLATREFQAESLGKAIPMRLDITGLQRQGQLATLNFTVTNMSDKEFWIPNFSFGESQSNPPDFDVSGVTLVDPQNAKRYKVARGGGSDGPCVCSNTKAVTIAKGGTNSFYATYSAPPAGLKTINVEIPLVGVINDVPIS